MNPKIKTREEYKEPNLLEYHGALLWCLSCMRKRLLFDDYTDIVQSLPATVRQRSEATIGLGEQRCYVREIYWTQASIIELRVMKVADNLPQ